LVDWFPPSTKIEILPERCGHDFEPNPKYGFVLKLGLFLSQQGALTKENVTAEQISIFVPG